MPCGMHAQLGVQSRPSSPSDALLTGCNAQATQRVVHGAVCWMACPRGSAAAAWQHIQMPGSSQAAPIQIQRVNDQKSVHCSKEAH